MRKIYLLITTALLLIGSGTMWAATSDTQTETSIARSGNGWTSSYVYYETATDIEDAMEADNNVRDFKIYPAFSSVEVINISNPNQNGVFFTLLDGNEIDLSNTTINVKEGCKMYFSASNQTKNAIGGVFNVETNAKLTLQYGNYNGTMAKCVGTGTINTYSNTIYDNVTFDNTEGGEILISDGTFKNDITINGTASITGGVFEASLIDKVRTFVDNKTCTIFPYEKDEEGSVLSYKVWKNSNIDATVNGVPYSDFAAAFNASSNDYPAVLMNNCSYFQYRTISDGATRWIDLNGKTLECSPTSTNYSFKVSKGKLKITDSSDDKSGLLKGKYIAENGAIIFVYGSTSSKAANYSILEIGEGVKIDNQSSSPTYIAAVVHLGTSSSTKKAAYGTVINIGQNASLSCENGSIFAINGNVNKTSGNVPQINIADGASLDTGCGSEACIYAAGYGIWNIGAATLNAGTPIYAKSGIININGATIEACGEYAEAQPYGNGFYGTGDGIVFDSKNGYAGNMQLIVNDATITSANGYAVQEVLTDREKSSQTLSMIIEGGKFKGEKGTIVVSENFNVSTPERWANNSIKSGKYTSAPNEVADGYVVALNTDDDKAEYPYVVVADNTYPGVVTEITTNTTETSVVEIAENHGILVKSGVTYDVKGILFTGANTRITVEPGATLIVGESGFIGSDAGRLLVLEADKANGTAKLKFNGTTEAASHVYAKVEQYMYAKALGSDTYVWQHIGSPMQTDQLNKISKTDPYLFNAWNVSGSWKYVDPSEVTSAWVGYNSTTNRTTEGSKLTYEGSLEGNSPAQFTFKPNGYNCFANSYVSALSIKETLGALSTSGVQTDGMIWIYDAALGKKWIQRNVEYYTIFGNDDEGIAPMQAFFLLNNSSNASSFTVSDYKTAVYDFNGETPVLKDAPDVNAGIITLTSGDESATLQIIEGDQYSDEIGPGDGYQMATDMVQIYVLQGESKLSAIATNSLKDKEIVIVTKANTSCTLSFSNLIGNAFKLTDIVTGAEVEVGADKTYTFTAEANSTIKRFKLGEGEVAANEADADGAVSIWTNNGQVFVANNAAEADIEIINLSGVKVAGAAANGESLQSVSISSLASGVYVVRVGNTTAKIVK